MHKEWKESKIGIYFEDAENEKSIRRSFNGVIQSPTDEQVTQFTEAIDAVSDLPSSHTILVEEYRYND